MLFEKNKKYQFQTDQGIVYTGQVIDTGNGFIKIQTIQNETIILNEKNLARAKQL